MDIWKFEMVSFAEYLEIIEDLDASAIEKLRQLRESEWYKEKLAKDKKTTYLGNGITVIPGSHTTIANW